MSCKDIHIVSVGKIKNTHCKALVQDYGTRLAYYRKLINTEVSDAKNPNLILEGQAEEAQRILNALTEQDIPVCLDEKGKTFTSVQFASFLQTLSENNNKRPCFIIGGAFGLHQSVKDKAKHMIALGPMTLTHEMARVFLYEQLYRAENIIRNTPYHH